MIVIAIEVVVRSGCIESVTPHYADHGEEKLKMQKVIESVKSDVDDNFNPDQDVISVFDNTGTEVFNGCRYYLVGDAVPELSGVIVYTSDGTALMAVPVIHDDEHHAKAKAIMRRLAADRDYRPDTDEIVYLQPGMGEPDDRITLTYPMFDPDNKEKGGDGA